MRVALCRRLRPALAAAWLAAALGAAGQDTAIDLGPRPKFLVDDMRDGPLRDRLSACLAAPPRRSAFSMGHRGAGIQLPEHTREAYEAAYRMGAGMLECDVTFTKDLALVCRHSQNDLATTTDILLTPLVATCIQPFQPAVVDADGRVVRRASAECRTSELTLAEFKTLRGKVDAFDPAATTVEQFVAAGPPPRADLGPSLARGTLLTHAESIALFAQLGVQMVPELKAPTVSLPFNGLTREAYAQRFIDDYITAGVDPRNVFPQSFERRDLEYWIAHAPEFGRQAVLLDGAERPKDVPSKRRLARYKAAGINIWAPPLFALLTLDDAGRIVASPAARAARAVGLDLVTWTLERSGNLAAPSSGFYYQTIDAAVTREGDLMEVIDVLARDVGVRGIFSDWSAPVSFYAGCMGLP